MEITEAEYFLLIRLLEDEINEPCIDYYSEEEIIEVLTKIHELLLKHQRQLDIETREAFDANLSELYDENNEMSKDCVRREEVAKELNGLHEEALQEIEYKDVLICFPYSDDTAFFKGCIEDEIDIFHGKRFNIVDGKIVETKNSHGDIMFEWTNIDKWILDSSKPHSVFVFDLDDYDIAYGVGFVFDKKDLDFPEDKRG